MTDPEPLDVPPFEMLTNKEKLAHIRQYHTIPYDFTSKTTRGELMKFHERAHAEEQWKQPHRHVLVSTNDSPGDLPRVRPDGTIDISRPLNASQRKSLKDLVDNDFAALRAEITQMAHDMIALRRKELRAEWAAKGSDQAQYVERARTLMKVYDNDIHALVREARENGVELKPIYFDKYQRSIQVEVEGLDAAILAARQEIESDKTRALNTLERQRLTAQRKVLMAGVDPAALAILDTIPSARELMLAAANERPGLEVTA